MFSIRSKIKKKIIFFFIIFSTSFFLCFGSLIVLTSMIVAIGGEEGSENTNNIPNFGNGSQAIVDLALTQLGNVGGQKFWSWYGFPSYQPWCACFVSWCGSELGYVDQNIMPKSALCDDFRTWFRNNGGWYDSSAHGGSYTPKPGDFLVFNWSGIGGDAHLDHIGIVKYVKDGRVYTVEGNTNSSEAAEHDYDLNNNFIIGYCSPAYPDTGNSNPEGSGPIDSQDGDLELLAHIIQCEAGSDFITDEEQLLVGSVVLNRVKNPQFPNSIREVIFAPGQYQPTWDGSWEANPPNERTLKNAAYLLKNGSIAPENVLYQAGSVLGTGIYKQFWHEELKNYTYICYG